MLASIRSVDNGQLLAERRPRHKVLVADDNFAAFLNVEQQLTSLGYDVATARNGEQACEMLEKNPQAADVVILDRRMPRLDGIAAFKRLMANAHLKNTPVIMLTAADSPEDIREGVQAGVFYYLAKPLKIDLLSAVLIGATRQVAKNRALLALSHKPRTCLELLDSCSFSFRTLEEADMLAVHIAGIFADPARVLNGAAELLSNAVEHGNLEIGFAEKGMLLKSGGLQQEIDKRLSSPMYGARRARAIVTRASDGVRLSVTDMGPGFNWPEFVAINFSRASHTHGRGIARARALSFDKLSFNAAGNKVVAFAAKEESINW